MYYFHHSKAAVFLYVKCDNDHQRPSLPPSLPLSLSPSFVSPSSLTIFICPGPVDEALRADDDEEEAEDTSLRGFADGAGLAKIAAEIDIVRRRCVKESASIILVYFVYCF